MKKQDKGILFFDIETSPNIGFFWKAGYKLNIPPEFIIKERQIICIAWKWEHENKYHCIDWGTDKWDHDLLVEFSKELNKAKMVIGQNHEQFDIKWFRGRLAYHGLPDIKVTNTADLLKLTRRSLNLNSYKLDYLSKFANGDGKIDNGGIEALKSIVMEGNQKALTRMKKYCINDVKKTVEAFEYYKPYLPIKYSNGLGFFDGECVVCNTNEHLKKDGTKITAAGKKIQRIKCTACGKNYTGPYV